MPKYICTCILNDEICFIDCNYFYVMSCDIIKRITLSWISFLVTHAIISMLFLSLPLFLLLLWNLRALKESNFVCRCRLTCLRMMILHHMVITWKYKKGFSSHKKCIERVSAYFKHTNISQLHVFIAAIMVVMGW